MTTYELISLFMSAAGFVSVLISLFLVYRQTRIFAQQAEYLARSLLENLSESMNKQSHEITLMFIEYPELRPYFYAGTVIEEGHPDYHRAESVAEAILDIFWSMAMQAKRMAKQDFFPKSAGNLWTDYLADAYLQSPLLVSVLTKRQNWYGEDMVDTMKRSLERGAQNLRDGAHDAPNPMSHALPANGDEKSVHGSHAARSESGSGRK